ncbi:hypothetical protein ASPBRDRAFT_41917 [Aspergillus brasiliensis CBS 101740]|uniref:Uncharacterized protein n=1 Tax=Aspergillus brasiliensis (strain CBS 101740 / IMI 381727 / IBT 21946) TaxID=767769 RepID=A0A1L9UR00_ASPBC|nr:hypothetical protein ASPBRDRAFT_41917 [Aspergillus brasiliensis CBS 101740]
MRWEFHLLLLLFFSIIYVFSGSSTRHEHKRLRSDRSNLTESDRLRRAQADQ